MGRYQAYFYDHPTEQLYVDGEPTNLPREYFHLEVPAITQPSVPYEFDGPASPQHKEQYRREYEAFLKSKELPEGISVPSPVVEPVKVEPAVVTKVEPTDITPVHPIEPVTESYETATPVEPAKVVEPELVTDSEPLPAAVIADATEEAETKQEA